MKRADFITILIGGILFAILLNIIFGKDNNTYGFLSPLPDLVGVSNEKASSQESVELAKIADSILDNANGKYGIVIQNLRTGELYTRNADRKFQPASLYKLWVAAYAFDQIDRGVIERDDSYSESISELNRLFDIDPENAEQTEGSITRTVESAIDQMITVSHNYSALLLSAELGNSKIGAYIKNLGLSDSSMGSPPMTTAHDIAKFYKLLYDGEIVNQQISSEYIDILAEQELNDRIPKYIPDEIKIAHKTGELGAFKHDAGIIFADDTILFVALSETSSQTTAAETIAKLAEAVFEYFEPN